MLFILIRRQKWQSLVFCLTTKRGENCKEIRSSSKCIDLWPISCEASLGIMKLQVMRGSYEQIVRGGKKQNEARISLRFHFIMYFRIVVLCRRTEFSPKGIAVLTLPELGIHFVSVCKTSLRIKASMFILVAWRNSTGSPFLTFPFIPSKDVGTWD